jgi:DNA modification methylase
VSGLERNRILVGDARERLADLPDSSIDCVITSVPYYQLRDYGVGGQIGLEQTVDAWVAELRLVMRGLARVLKPSGAAWFNIGDSYSRRLRSGAPAKSLLLGPERLLLALSADGWIVRSKVIWAKTNPVPVAVIDRLSNSYDVIYFVTRSPRYFFDLDAIRLPYRDPTGKKHPIAAGLLGKNPGDVWMLPSANFRGAHFATFPPALVERPLLATCPELICDRCGTPFTRASHRRRQELGKGQTERPERHVLRYSSRYTVIHERGPLLSSCACRSTARSGVVLDPFFGAGTVGLVAEKHHRDWIGIEINPFYVRLARKRIASGRTSTEATDERRAA